MKQLTHNILKMNFRGVSLSDVKKVEIAFAQKKGEPPLKVETYPGDNTVLLGENQIGVIWSAEQTALFTPGKPFYCDTRITLADSPYQPSTPIIKLVMNQTLFEE